MTKIPGADQIGMAWVLLLERLGSFALVAYVVLYGFPKIEERLNKLEQSQRELVTIWRDYVVEIRTLKPMVKK
jgi:hypothetical protein